MSAAGVLAGQGHVRIGVDDQPLFNGLKSIQSRLKAVGQQISAAGTTMFSFGAAGLAALVPSVMAASNAAEGYNRFLAVMGSEAMSTDAALAEMAKTIGRSHTEMRDTASSFQGMFVGLGMNRAEAARLATQMTELSLDFASFNNLADSDASERFLAGLSGSGEVFDRFGINIKEAALKAKLAQMGISGTATELQKTQARIAIITESMARQGATKDATTTAGSFANQLKAIAAEAKAAAESIGNGLIPELNAYLPELRATVKSAGEWLKQNPEMIIGFAKLAAGATAGGLALMAVAKTIEGMSSVYGAAAGALKLLKDHWTSIPKIIPGPQALIVAGVLAITAEVAGFRAVLGQLNDELERTKSLEAQMREVEDRRRKGAAAPTTRDEIASALKAEDERTAAIQSHMAALRREIATEIDNTGAFGFDILGTTGSQNAELDELKLKLSETTQRATDLRKQLQTANEEAVKAEEEQKKKDKPTLAERAKFRRTVNQFMPENLAASASESVVNKALQVANSLKSKMTDGSGLPQIQRSLSSIFSSTAATGLAARTETIKKTEDFLDTIANNTQKTVEAIKNMPGLKLG